MPDSLTEDRKRAYRGLLDDESPPVRDALLRQFRDLGGPGVAFLRELAAGEDRRLGGHAAWFLREMRVADPVADVLAFIRSQGLELETGALLLGRVVEPGLEAADVCLLLDELAARVRELLPEPARPRERCRVLTRVVFHEWGLTVQEPARPEDAGAVFLHQTLRRRRGTRLTAGLVLLLVGQRAGLQLEPVLLPDGELLVACFHDDRPFFLDPGAHGRPLAPDEVFDRLRRRHVLPRAHDLAPTPVREVLARLCRDFSASSRAAGAAEHARLFGILAAEFDGLAAGPGAGPA